MRTISLAVAVALLVPSIALGQAGTIGIFSDTWGANCNITDTSPSTLLPMYVVHVGTAGATACEFSAPKPACFTGTYLSDTYTFAVTIGNSQTGVTVGYGVCRTGSTHVLTINYLAAGTTPSCCVYPVLPDPNLPSGQIEIADCDYNLMFGLGQTGVVNANASCPCGSYPIAPSNPSPSHGAAGVSTSTQLSWVASDPQGGPLIYDVYLGTSSNPPLVAVDQTQNSYDPGLLTYNTRYYWKVAARDIDNHETLGPVWTFTTANPGNRLVVSSSTNYCGMGLTSDDTVRVEIMVQNNPTPIDAAGVDVPYDPSVLTFVRCEAGDLTSGWGYFRGTNRGSYIRVGGFDQTPIPQASSGTFARLVFAHDVCAVVSPGVVNMCPQNLTDDFVPLAPECGAYQYYKFYADGDVNYDGHVTPGDALCAFKSYLSFPIPPAGGCNVLGWEVRSDVNCSRSLTPADALCIFENWLDESCPFCIDWSSTVVVANTMPSTPPVVNFAVTRGEEREATVVVKVSRVEALKAFGFELSYPADQMEYAGIERTAVTQRMDQLDANVLVPGRLRVGGYTTRAVSASRTTDILKIRFKTSTDVLSGPMTINTFVDHLQGASPATRYLEWSRGEVAVGDIQMLQNYPNPFNPVTEISYEILPAVDRLPVKLVVYDVEGKRVRGLVDAEQPSGAYRVRWDGKNDNGSPVSSGVYFYVLNAGQQVIKKKMLLLK